MTKPIGRPRGRPKTKAYTTLMARVDLAVADRVKRYASLHRQPISVVIRDALMLLMEEYPANADGSGPHRLAAHEFLSDRYESPLDTLLSETDSAGLDALMSDTHEEVVETLLADAQQDDALLSDIQAGMPERTAASTTASAATPTGTPARARSRKGSDTTAARVEVPQRTRGRQSGPMRQRILTLLAAHPEGLSADDLRVSLNADPRLGETLQDMRQAGVVTTRGRGKALRSVGA
jgi:hypothetical protein